MKEKGEVVWSEKFISGNEEIDRYHKQIIDGVIELYKMLDDTRQHSDAIPEMTRKIEEALLEHMDIEIDYLKRFNLIEWVAHENSHNLYRKDLDFYRNYSISPAIRAVMVGESVRDYMRTHFFQFDVKDIQKINQKLKEHDEGPKESY